MSILTTKLKTIISSEIHKAKCNASLKKEQWAEIDSIKIAEVVLKQICEVIECFAYLPCCHTSGMHDPEHFKNGIICELQKSEAFERLCKDLEINPVTKSKLDCYWCMNDPTNRIGEGVHLFQENTCVNEI